MSEISSGRPAYGEYATPEEQRASIRVPVDDNAGIPLEADAPKPAASRATAPAATTAEKLKARRGDILATYALLGVGLATIFLTSTSMLQLPLALDSAFDQFGIGDYTADGVATAMGWTALIVYLALWAAAFLISRRLIAAGRLSWWVPLVAGVVANIVAIVCTVIAILADPAYIAYAGTLQK